MKFAKNKPVGDSFSHLIVGLGSPDVLHWVENGELNLVRMSVGSIRNLGLTFELELEFFTRRKFSNPNFGLLNWSTLTLQINGNPAAVLAEMVGHPALVLAGQL